MNDPDNPFETPVPRGMWLVQGTLRVIIAIQCWGMAAGRLHLGHSSKFIEFLAPAYGMGAEQVNLTENSIAYALIACGLLTLFRPCWMVLVPVVIWQAGVATGFALAGESFLDRLQPVEQAVRFTCPMALLLVDFWPPKVRPTLAFCLSSIGLLRLATVATFAAHGIAAIYQFQNNDAGDMTEIVTLSASKLFQYDLSTINAERALGVIGVVDIGLAMSLMSSRHRGIALAMVLWGGAIAFSYTLAYGAEGYDQTLIRIGNAGAPLVVLIFWVAAVQEQKPVIMPEEE